MRMLAGDDREMPSEHLSMIKAGVEPIILKIARQHLHELESDVPHCAPSLHSFWQHCVN